MHGPSAQVPIKTRQPTLNRLLGQHLATGLLQTLKLDATVRPKSAQQAVRDRADIRATAIAAARAQELALYKACASSPTVCHHTLNFWTFTVCTLMSCAHALSHPSSLSTQAKETAKDDLSGSLGLPVPDHPWLASTTKACDCTAQDSHHFACTATQAMPVPNVNIL